jgi:hypothetical protein
MSLAVGETYGRSAPTKSGYPERVEPRRNSTPAGVVNLPVSGPNRRKPEAPKPPLCVRDLRCFRLVSYWA